MMRITLVPIRMEEQLVAERKGESLVLNGQEIDLSAATRTKPLTVADTPWILGEVTRSAEGLAVTLLLPHGADAPAATRFPAEIVHAGDGPIDLPPYQAEPAPDSSDCGLDLAALAAADLSQSHD